MHWNIYLGINASFFFFLFFSKWLRREEKSSQVCNRLWNRFFCTLRGTKMICKRFFWYVYIIFVLFFLWSLKNFCSKKCRDETNAHLTLFDAVPVLKFSCLWFQLVWSEREYTLHLHATLEVLDDDDDEEKYNILYTNAARASRVTSSHSHNLRTYSIRGARCNFSVHPYTNSLLYKHNEGIKVNL